MSWTLGSSTGTNTLIAAVPGAAPVTFTATAGNGPDLAFGFVSTQTSQPVQIRRSTSAGWVEATGDTLTVFSGETIELRAYFRNAGDAEVDAAFDARMRYDSNETWLGFNWPLGTLLLTTQGYIASTRVVSGPTVGCTTTLRVAEVQLDSGASIAESDEGNNTALLQYKVCAPPIN